MALALVMIHQSTHQLNFAQGELAMFYHSNIGKEIVGVVRVAREAYPDATAEKGDWVAVDMETVGPMP